MFRIILAHTSYFFPVTVKHITAVLNGRLKENVEIL